MRIAMAAAAAAMILAAPASAAIQTFYFSGLSDDGSRYTGSISYDDAVAPIEYEENGGVSGYGLYRALTAFEAAGAGWSVTFTGGGSGRNVEVYNAGRGFVDSMAFNPAAGDMAGSYLPGYELAGVFFAFDTTEDVWPTPALPDTSAFARMENIGLSVSFRRLDGGPSVGFGGKPDYIGDAPFAAVPEPASWALMIAGFGLAGAAARRRRLPAVSYSRSSG